MSLLYGTLKLWILFVRAASIALTNITHQWNMGGYNGKMYKNSTVLAPSEDCLFLHMHRPSSHEGTKPINSEMTCQVQEVYARVAADTH